MVTLFRKNGYQWLILAVGILIILGLADWTVVEAESKVDTRLAKLQKGLVLYYSFDTDQGRNVTDLSGKGNHGKVRSGTYTSNGKIGKAMFFNGDGDYIDIGDDPNIQTEIFTFTAWIKTIDMSGVWQTIISFEELSHAVSVLPNGHIHYGWQAVKRGGEGKSDVRSGKWVFVAITRDSKDKAAIYVDGELENSFVCDMHSKFYHTGKVGGEYPGTEYFNGSIDEVRIYNRALSAAETSQIYDLTLRADVGIPSDSKTATTEDIRIDPDPNWGQVRVSGVVRDEQGTPISDVLITLRGGEDCKTDAEGRFEGCYLLRHTFRHSNQIYVFARHDKRNLAAAAKIFKGKDHELEIELTEPVTLAGQITDPDGNPIPDTKLCVWLCDDNWGTFVYTNEPKNLAIDSKGNYRIRLLPHGCFYEIEAGAPGYGIGTIEVGTWDRLKKRIDLDRIILHPANLSVSGIVVDEKGARVPHAGIACRGKGQPDHGQPIQTDTKGNFKNENLCEGTIVIQAWTSDKEGQLDLLGEIDAEVGEESVKIVVHKGLGVCKIGPEPISLMGEKLPQFKDLSLPVDREQVKNKMLLICFWDTEHQGSRHCIRKLAQVAGQLEKRDIAAFAVHMSKIDKKSLADLAKKFNITFPVGMVAGDIDKILSTWGVLTHPWVILTDRTHTVIKEDFGLQVLRELSE